MGAENGLLKAEIVSMKQDLARAVSTAKESFELASGYTEVMAGLDEQHSYDIADVDRAAKTQVAESLQSAIDSLSHVSAQAIPTTTWFPGRFLKDPCGFRVTRRICWLWRHAIERSCRSCERS